MKLLREMKIEGFPRDYLYARIRCRRAALDLSGHSRWGGPEEPHTTLGAEYVWVYEQMDRRLRCLLLPVFEYLELRTLVIALRYMAAGDRSSMDKQLRLSLLHPQVLKLLKNAKKVALVTAGLERVLEKDRPYFRGLTETYLHQGPGGFEQALVGGCLQWGLSFPCSNPVRGFLLYMLDMRNLLALYKHLYWQVPVNPPLLTGGTLDIASYEKIWAERNLADLLVLMGKRAGLNYLPGVNDTEEYMLRGLTTSLKREGRDPLQPGLILDYLWRCQLTARKRALDLSYAELSAERAAEEVAG